MHVDARQLGDGVRVEAGGVDDDPCGDREPLAVFVHGLDDPSGGPGRQCLDLRVPGDVGAMHHRLPAVTVDQSVCVHNPRLRRPQGADRREHRVAAPYLRTVDQPDFDRTGGVRSDADLLEHLELRVVRRDDQLSRAAMRDAHLSAALVQLAPSRDAHAGLERVRRIVQACVDHSAVAAGGLPSCRLVALDHDHRAASLAQGARARQPHHARPDDHNIRCLARHHVNSLAAGPARK